MIENITRHRKSGFTLIELLVVIAIIAILASMLSPALISAKASAKKVMCVNNIKQMGILSFSYQDEFGGYVPNYSTTYCVAASYSWYLGRVFPVKYGNIPDSSGSIIYCPVETEWNATDISATFEKVSTYGFNHRVNMMTAGVVSPIRNLRKPSKVMMLTENAGARSNVMPKYETSGNQAEVIRFRHMKKANSFFFDGHIESRDILKVPLDDFPVGSSWSDSWYWSDNYNNKSSSQSYYIANDI